MSSSQSGPVNLLLGPATEARIESIFAKSLTIDAKTASTLIGCDVKSLSVGPKTC
jgi:hypothetical protein